MKFKNLKNTSNVTASSTYKYIFYELDGEPWIEVRPAAECNKKYFNAVLRKQKATRRKLQAGKIDTAMLKQNREEDRELFPKFVCTGRWGGWTDNEGKEIPFTVENARDLFDQLPDYMFDEFRADCNILSNFIDIEDGEDEPLDQTDAEEAAGN
jgi:hypothetical protein